MKCIPTKGLFYASLDRIDSGSVAGDLAPSYQAPSASCLGNNMPSKCWIPPENLPAIGLRDIVEPYPRPFRHQGQVIPGFADCAKVTALELATCGRISSRSRLVFLAQLRGEAWAPQTRFGQPDSRSLGGRLPCKIHQVGSRP